MTLKSYGMLLTATRKQEVGSQRRWDVALHMVQGWSQRELASINQICCSSLEPHNFSCRRTMENINQFLGDNFDPQQYSESGHCVCSSGREQCQLKIFRRYMYIINILAGFGIKLHRRWIATIHHGKAKWNHTYDRLSGRTRDPAELPYLMPSEIPWFSGGVPPATSLQLWSASYSAAGCSCWSVEATHFKLNILQFDPGASQTSHWHGKLTGLSGQWESKGLESRVGGALGPNFLIQWLVSYGFTMLYHPPVCLLFVQIPFLK